MPLLVDKTSLCRFEDLDLHLEASSPEDFPHLLVYGPRGSGKMTRIRAILNELFDKSANKIKIDEKGFQTPSGKKIEVTVFSSNFHIEINPSDAGLYDRIVIQEVIKELAQTQQVDKSKTLYKVAVILEADKLSRDAQHSLRRTMEKYSSNLRLVFCATTVEKLIEPIKSRCMMIRVPGLDYESVNHLISSATPSFKLSEDNMLGISSKCDGNGRKALLMTEAVIQNGSVLESDWELCIHKIVDQILKEQSPNSLGLIRSMFYELLSHCVPASILLKKILLNFIEKEKRIQVIEGAVSCCALYESRMAKGNKPIFHLEAFTANLMSILSIQ